MKIIIALLICLVAAQPTSPLLTVAKTEEVASTSQPEIESRVGEGKHTQKTEKEGQSKVQKVEKSVGQVSKQATKQVKTEASTIASNLQSQPKSGTILETQAPSSIQPLTQAQELINGLKPIAKAQESTSWIPSDDEYDAIKLTLQTTLVLYVIIQLLSCICKKDRKRYTQKFEQFSQRSQVTQLQEEQ